MPETTETPKMATTMTMAISLPEKFLFEALDWEHWLRRWERYRMVTGLDKQSEEYQVNNLIYAMGPKGEALMDAVNLSAENMNKYDVVKMKTQYHFIPKVNYTYQRALFNKRRQQLGESMEAFIADSHTLAAKCSYGSIKDDLIRDLIVIGILDSKLSKQLQLDDALILARVVTRVTKSELVGKQLETVR